MPVVIWDKLWRSTEEPCTKALFLKDNNVPLWVVTKEHLNAEGRQEATLYDDRFKLEK